MKKSVMTLQEAFDAGYKIGDRKYQRGYASRKVPKFEDIPVFVAGGRRKNELYILVPCWGSTRYCYRQYLYKEDAL